MTPEDLARMFHEAYERLAPSHGYQTREASAVAWEDVPQRNKDLMISTCAEVLVQLMQENLLDDAVTEILGGVPFTAYGPPVEEHYVKARAWLLERAALWDRAAARDCRLQELGE